MMLGLRNIQDSLFYGEMAQGSIFRHKLSLQKLFEIRKIIKESPRETTELFLEYCPKTDIISVKANRDYTNYTIVYRKCESSTPAKATLDEVVQLCQDSLSPTLPSVGFVVDCNGISSFEPLMGMICDVKSGKYMYEYDLQKLYSDYRPENISWGISMSFPFGNPGV
jgi:hypothetical protein